MRALEARARQPTLGMIILPNGTRVRRQAGGQVVVSGWIASHEGLRLASTAHGFPGEAERSSKASSTVEEASHDATAPSHQAGAETSTSVDPLGSSSDIAEAPTDGPSMFKASPDSRTAAVDFVVVCQLRNSFATRFLMAAGQHQSRVGVDFVDL